MIVYVKCDNNKIKSNLYNATLEITKMDFLKDYQPTYKFNTHIKRIYFNNFVLVFVLDDELEMLKRDERFDTQDNRCIVDYKYSGILDSIRKHSEEFRRI